MGKLKGGIKGNVSGKVANLVFVTTGDRNYVRSSPTPPKNFSQAQRLNHDNLTNMNKWLKPLVPFLKVGCKNDVPHMSGYGLALSHISANAVRLEEGRKIIEPEKVMVSLGNLPGSPTASVALEEQEVVFTWNPVVGAQCSNYDGVLLLAYNVEHEAASYSLKGSFRKDGSARLQIFHAGTYFCYLGFVAEDQSRQSNSQYLGTIIAKVSIPEAR